MNRNINPIKITNMTTPPCRNFNVASPSPHDLNVIAANIGPTTKIIPIIILSKFFATSPILALLQYSVFYYLHLKAFMSFYLYIIVVVQFRKIYKLN